MDAGHAEQTATLSVGAGGFGELIVDPLILFPGARLDRRTQVIVDAAATAITGDSFLWHDPAGGAGVFDWLASEVVFSRPDGRVLAVDRFRIDGPTAAGRIPGPPTDRAPWGHAIQRGVEISAALAETSSASGCQSSEGSSRICCARCRLRRAPREFPSATWLTARLLSRAA